MFKKYPWMHHAFQITRVHLNLFKVLYIFSYCVVYIPLHILICNCKDTIYLIHDVILS